jgi:hypothetical protein
VAQHAGNTASQLEFTTLRRECELLQQQLDATRTMLQREQEHAAERERDYREQIRYLSRMLQEERQRYDRLLEAPRASPPAQASRPTTARGDPHAMRRRILAVLQANPAGLHHTVIAKEFGYTGDLGPTLRAMHRDQLVRRVREGVYGVTE